MKWMQIKDYYYVYVTDRGRVIAEVTMGLDLWTVSAPTYKELHGARFVLLQDAQSYVEQFLSTQEVPV